MGTQGVGGHYWVGVREKGGLFACSVCGAQREEIPRPKLDLNPEVVTPEEALSAAQRHGEVTKLRMEARAPGGGAEVRVKLLALRATEEAWEKEVRQRKRARIEAQKTERERIARFRFRELADRPWSESVPTCSRRRGELALIAAQKDYVAGVASAGSVSVPAWGFYLTHGRFPHQGEITADGAVRTADGAVSAPQATTPGVG